MSLPIGGVSSAGNAAGTGARIALVVGSLVLGVASAPPGQAQVNATAATLADLGLTKGDPLAILSHNCWQFPVLSFATARIGVVLVPINFRLVAEEVRYIVAHSGTRLLLVDPELADAMTDVECEHKLIIGAESDAVLMKFGVEPAGWDGDEDATGTINFTTRFTLSPGITISTPAGNSIDPVTSVVRK